MRTPAARQLVQWAEELHPFGSDEHVLSESSIERVRAFAEAIEEQALKRAWEPCRFRLANAWEVGVRARLVVGVPETNPPPPPPSDRG